MHTTIDEILTRGVEKIYPTKEALETVLRSDKKLRIYYGIDPTGKLHLGHAVQLLKLRQFQDLGHEIIILIGDFTARIGDPTDKLAMRKQLSKEEVGTHSSDYKELIDKIIDTTKANVRFLHNEQWSNALKPEDMLELASHFTVSQLLERDMFQERIKSGKEIYLHEFMYPVFQAYDAVTMDVDMQIGGNDQTFNMLAGRTLMKRMKNKEKFVLTTKLLVDDSGNKMGKTAGNIVPLEDSPQEMFGKIMSWPDELIVVGFELLTRLPMAEITKIKQDIKGGANPRDAKLKLAGEIVKLFWGEAGAKQGSEHFAAVFQNKQQPDEIGEWAVSGKSIIDALVGCFLAQSRSDAHRLIEQGGIKINHQVVTDETMLINSGDVIQKGKREFVKVI